MPQKSWAVGEEVLASDFNLYLQNQVIPAFTTAAQRDAQWASPPNGAMCVTTDTSTLWQRVGATWWGALSRVATTRRDTAGDYGFTGTVETAPILSAGPIAVPGGRRLRIEVTMRGANCSVANDRAYLNLKDGSTLLQVWSLAFNANFQANGGSIWVAVIPTTGAHTYTLTAAGGQAGGNYNLQVSAGAPMILDVYDIGAL